MSVVYKPKTSHFSELYNWLSVNGPVHLLASVLIINGHLHEFLDKWWCWPFSACLQRACKSYSQWRPCHRNGSDRRKSPSAVTSQQEAFKQRRKQLVRWNANTCALVLVTGSLRPEKKSHIVCPHSYTRTNGFYGVFPSFSSSHCPSGFA